MSASNWRECPGCFAKEKDRREKLKKKAAASYGKVSEEKYLAMLARSQEEDDSEEYSDDDSAKQSLREDIQIYVDIDGEFICSYSCSCGRCGFEFNFKHEEQALKNKP